MSGPFKVTLSPVFGRLNPWDWMDAELAIPAGASKPVISELIP